MSELIDDLGKRGAEGYRVSRTPVRTGPYHRPTPPKTWPKPHYITGSKHQNLPPHSAYTTMHYDTKPVRADLSVVCIRLWCGPVRTGIGASQILDLCISILQNSASSYFDYDPMNVVAEILNLSDIRK